MSTSIPTFRWLGAACVLGVAAHLHAPARAMTYVQMTDADLVAQADGAVVATVVAEPKPVLDANGVRVAANYVLAVEENLGGLASVHQSMELPGWHGQGAPAWHVPGVVALQAGDRIVLLYERRADGVLLPLQLNLGVFVERGVGSERILERALENAVDMGAGTNRQYGAARDSERFKRYLRARFVGGDPPVDYLLPDVARPKFTSLTGAGTRVRWFQFDMGTTVNWRANSDGQTGMVQDEFALLQTALAAWTNDATSRIQWGYGGTIAPGAGNPPSPYARVIWNDPLGEIGGSYNCGTGGTLAIAGPSWIVSPTIYRGTPYNAIQNARLVTQDNAGCFFDSSGGANGAEVFAHEIGHTLGFGHSCGDPQSPACAPNPLLNDAIMRALAHGDGRGASLRVDDIAAANEWYFLSVSDVIFANGFE